MSTEIKLFAPHSSMEFGQKIARALDTMLSPHEEREFEDGEHKSRSLENVRNRDVYVIYSLHGEPGMSVKDKLCRLLFFVGSLKDAAAKACSSSNTNQQESNSTKYVSNTSCFSTTVLGYSNKSINKLVAV